MEDAASTHSRSTVKGASTPALPIAPHQRASSLSTSTHLCNSASVTAASAPQTRKRLSVSFPILPANSNVPPRNVSPTMASSSSPPSYSPGTPGISGITPDDPMAFLTALAAQERRVLELREELGKAETELGKMKKKWALHEATRKIHEIPTPIERLPLNTSVAGCAGVGAGADDQRGRIISPTREQYNARKATLNSLNGTSNRKVLPSQRHQRTLSLLSTDRMTTYRQSFPQPTLLDDETSGTTSETPPATIQRSQTFAQSSTSLPSTATSTPTRPLSLGDFSTLYAKQRGQDALIRTGKQMAEDFKGSLWTFIEDLRQATVGDEGIQSSLNPSGIRATSNHPMKRQSSRTSIRSNSSGKVPKASNPAKSQPLIDFGVDESKGALDEGVKDSSSSSARWSMSSTIMSDIPGATTPPSRSSTPRTSTSSMASNSNNATTQPWNSVIPTQFNLKKTATALMTSVEKSLASLPYETAATGFYAPGKDAGHLRSRSIPPQLKSKKA